MIIDLERDALSALILSTKPHSEQMECELIEMDAWSKDRKTWNKYKLPLMKESVLCEIFIRTALFYRNKLQVGSRDIPTFKEMLNYKSKSIEKMKEIKELEGLAEELQERNKELTRFEAMQLAVQLQRNLILKDAFVLYGSGPSALESIAMHLGQTPIL